MEVSHKTPQSNLIVLKVISGLRLKQHALTKLRNLPQKNISGSGRRFVERQDVNLSLSQLNKIDARQDFPHSNRGVGVLLQNQ